MREDETIKRMLEQAGIAYTEHAEAHPKRKSSIEVEGRGWEDATRPGRTGSMALFYFDPVGRLVAVGAQE